MLTLWTSSTRNAGSDEAVAWKAVEIGVVACEIESLLARHSQYSTGGVQMTSNLLRCLAMASCCSCLCFSGHGLAQNSGDGSRTSVSLVDHGNCGVDGKFINVKNRHRTRSIKVDVKTTWIYNNGERSNLKAYKLRPGEEKHHNCSIPGPTMQVFRSTIESTQFAP